MNEKWHYCHVCKKLIPVELRGKYITRVYGGLQMAQVNWTSLEYTIHFCSDECKKKDEAEQEALKQAEIIEAQP
jgi:hypothetical protein